MTKKELYDIHKSLIKKEQGIYKNLAFLLDNIKHYASYYIGGSLCVDTESDIICINIRDGKVFNFITSELICNMDQLNWEKALKIYILYNNNTNYYLEAKRNFENTFKG